MLAPETRFQPNIAEVAAKVIDGEAIIMNLSNGLYFSLDHTGASLWELLEAGYSLGEMAEALGSRFGVERSVVLEDATRLVGELLAEGLVHESEGGQRQALEPVSEAAQGAYASPVLNKYSDMADLLALDPPMPKLGAGNVQE